MKIKTAVVLLAGYGTRCLPFSLTIPKAFLPVLNKPTIQYIVEEIVESGINNIIFVLPKGRMGRLILKHFKQNKDFEKFLKDRKKFEELKEVQKIKKLAKIKGVFAKPNGSGGAVLRCEKLLKNQPAFVVLNGDDLFFGKPTAIKELLDVYEKTNSCVIGLGEVKESEKNQYGIVEGKLDQDLIEIEKLIEKPKPNQTKSNFALFGRYILTNQIFTYLKKIKPNLNGELLLTDAIILNFKQNKTYGKVLSAKRFDGGNKLGILKANIYLAYQQELLFRQIAEYLEELKKR